MEFFRFWVPRGRYKGVCWHRQGPRSLLSLQQGMVDCGKHASSMIGVDLRFLEPQWEGGMGEGGLPTVNDSGDFKAQFAVIYIVITMCSCTSGG